MLSNISSQIRESHRAILESIRDNKDGLYTQEDSERAAYALTGFDDHLVDSRDDISYFLALHKEKTSK